ncbi:MAG: hypothetical protein QM755_02640 [Luteolibacter sp.]
MKTDPTSSAEPAPSAAPDAEPPPPVRRIYRKRPRPLIQQQQYLPLRPLLRRVMIGHVAVGVDPTLHHLAKVNGVWCVRLTIDLGRLKVGRRIKVSLTTGDAEIAKQKRDLIIRAYQELGLTIVGLPQRS